MIFFMYYYFNLSAQGVEPARVCIIQASTSPPQWADTNHFSKDKYMCEGMLILYANNVRRKRFATTAHFGTMEHFAYTPEL